MQRFEKLLVLTLLVFLPSQLSFHWWSSWSLVSGVRVDYLSPTFYLTDFLAIILVLYGFIKKYIQLSNKLLLLILVAAINISFAYSPLVALFAWLRFGELLLLGFYFYQRSQKLKSEIAAGLIVAMLWSSLLAIWQFLLHHSVGGAWKWLGERSISVSTPGIAKLDLGAWGYWLRPYATLPHPNALAAFLFIGSLLIIYFNSIHIKKYWWLGLPIFLAILLSWSRSVFVAILALIFPWALPVVLLLPGNPTSLVERWQLAKMAFISIQHHLLFGVGLGNFIPALKGQTYQPVHNIFILLWSELGLLFIIPLLYLIKFIKILFAEKHWILLKIILVIMGLGFVDHYWLTLHQTSLLFTIALAQIKLKSET